jgi:hypothetical protein
MLSEILPVREPARRGRPPRRAAWGLVLAAALAAAACSSDPKKQIVGKWEETEGGGDLEAVEFDGDGGVKVYLKGDSEPVRGTYELVGGKELKLDKVYKGIMARLDERLKVRGANSVTLPGWIMYDKKVEVAVSSSELEVKDGGKTRKYRRVK